MKNAKSGSALWNTEATRNLLCAEPLSSVQLLKLDAPDLASFQDHVLRAPKIMMFQTLVSRDDSFIAPNPDYICRLIILDLPECFFGDLIDDPQKRSDKLTMTFKNIIEKAKAHFKPQRVIITVYDNSRFSGIVSYCAVVCDAGIMWMNPLGKTKLQDIKCEEDRANALRTRVRTMIAFYKVGNTPVTQLSPAKGIDVSKLPKKK